MIEIVINFDPQKQYFKIYEPSSDSLMVSANLTEALCILNKFLLDSGMIQEDILKSPNISYHIDSYTMKGIIEGNLKLVKRLNQAPSGFQVSSQRFNGSGNGQQQGGEKKKKPSSGLASATGFRSAYRKFGGNNF
jgi:hypothetical protein